MAEKKFLYDKADPFDKAVVDHELDGIRKETIKRGQTFSEAVVPNLRDAIINDRDNNGKNRSPNFRG